MEANGSDPVLLITGASSGIGAATARAAASGYRLVLAARKVEPLKKLVEELGGAERAGRHVEIARRRRRRAAGAARGVAGGGQA